MRSRVRFSRAGASAVIAAVSVTSSTMCLGSTPQPVTIAVSRSASVTSASEVVERFTDRVMSSPAIEQGQRLAAVGRLEHALRAQRAEHAREDAALEVVILDDQDGEGEVHRLSFSTCCSSRAKAASSALPDSAARAPGWRTE
jgi:hypothetical protein